MQIDFNALFALLAFSAAIHWIVARATIMKWFWSLKWCPWLRVALFIDALLMCPACSGWWIGLGLAALGIQPVHFTQLAWATNLANFLGAGLLACLGTPIMQSVMLWGLERSKID